MNRHLDEDAELLALGALEPQEREDAERHIATCDECAARVAAAESVVAALAGALPAYEPVREPAGSIQPQWKAQWWIAAAAAVLLGIASGLGWYDAGLRSQRAQSDVALAAVVHGHFNHVGLSKADATAPDAKLLYARDGSWLYLVVDRPVAGLRLVAKTPGQPDRLLGNTRSDGKVSTLFVPRAGRMTSVALMDDGGVRATATLKY